MSGTASLTLPRECRLLRGPDYEAVYSEGRRRSSKYFAVFLRRNNSDVTRFGWSIKKAIGNAVRRNRVRRRLREIVRLHRHEIGDGWDVVIHPRDSAMAAEFSDLSRDLLKLLPGR